MYNKSLIWNERERERENIFLQKAMNCFRKSVGRKMIRKEKERRGRRKREGREKVKKKGEKQKSGILK